MKKISHLLLRFAIGVACVALLGVCALSVNAQDATSRAAEKMLAQLGYGPISADAFLRAAGAGDTNALQLFLYLGDKGGRFPLPNARDSFADKSTALSAALRAASGEGKTEAIEYLLANGADLNSKNRYRRNALMLAAEKGHTETVKVLIEKGAKVNDTDDDRKSALILAAAQASNYETMKVLLANKADPNIKDNSGDTALDHARKNGHKNLVELLKSSTVGAAEIDGAFGLKLGEVFDVAKAKQIASDEYEFVPESKVAPFSHYTVSVTPLTHKIATISAYALASEFSEGQIDVLVAALLKKYGGAPNQSGFVHHRREIGDRSILFHSYGVSLKQGDTQLEHRIGIDYSDRNVYDIADREAAEVKKTEAASKQRELDNKAKALEKSGL